MAGNRNICPLKGEDFYNRRQTWAGRKETYNGSSPSSNPWDPIFTRLQFNSITVQTMAFVILMFIWDWCQLKSSWNVQNIGLEPNVGLCFHYLTKLSICKWAIIDKVLLRHVWSTLLAFIQVESKNRFWASFMTLSSFYNMHWLGNKYLLFCVKPNFTCLEKILTEILKLNLLNSAIDCRLFEFEKRFVFT